MAFFATCEQQGTGSWWGRNLVPGLVLLGVALIVGASGLAVVSPETFE